LFLGLVPGWLNPLQPAHAQSESAYDLIHTVNTLRASLGLAAYSIDPWLMSYAQEHADYIDSLNSGTHVHSDGTLPWDSGIQENVAGGTTGLVTATVVVYQIWVDEGHYKVMTGYPNGEIGAGLAYSTDNGQTYFVIDVRPAEAGEAAPAPAVTAAFVPYVTNTPRADGWIVHIVTEGQTLWSIAISYGTTVNAIRELNGIPADSTVIYVGQELKVIQGVAIRPTLTSNPEAAAVLFATATSPPPSATPEPSPTATAQPSATATSTPTNWLERLPPERMSGAIVLLVIGVVGLLLVIRFGFIGSRRAGR
jgi:LysM repeat protein